jgi:hypothetical protein
MQGVWGDLEEGLLVPKAQEGAGGWEKPHIVIRNFVFCNLRQIVFAEQNKSSPHFEDERRILDYILIEKPEG